jgi:hypothetical protein
MAPDPPTVRRATYIYFIISTASGRVSFRVYLPSSASHVRPETTYFCAAARERFIEIKPFFGFFGVQIDFVNTRTLRGTQQTYFSCVSDQ